MDAITRQTALLLSALPAEECEWLLGHLAPQRAQGLRRLIDEARDLGIECPGAMIPSLIDALEQLTRPTDARSVVDLACVDTLCQMLADAPPRLTACLLAAHTWQWHEAFLARFAGPQKRELLAILREPDFACPPRLAEALIDELSRQLPARSPAVVPRPAKSRLRAFARAFPILGRRGAVR